MVVVTSKMKDYQGRGNYCLKFKKKKKGKVRNLKVVKSFYIG